MHVMEDQAFVLINPPSNTSTDGHMDMYVLDLQAWHWTRLPAQNDAPPRCTNFTPVVVQVSKHHAVCHHPSCFPKQLVLNLLLQQLDVLANGILWCSESCEQISYVVSADCDVALAFASKQCMSVSP